MCNQPLSFIHRHTLTLTSLMLDYPAKRDWQREEKIRLFTADISFLFPALFLTPRIRARRLIWGKKRMARKNPCKTNQKLPNDWGQDEWKLRRKTFSILLSYAWSRFHFCTHCSTRRFLRQKQFFKETGQINFLEIKTASRSFHQSLWSSHIMPTSIIDLCKFV